MSVMATSLPIASSGLRDNYAFFFSFFILEALTHREQFLWHSPILFILHNFCVSSHVTTPIANMQFWLCSEKGRGWTVRSWNRSKIERKQSASLDDSRVSCNPKKSRRVLLVFPLQSALPPNNRRSAWARQAVYIARKPFNELRYQSKHTNSRRLQTMTYT